MPNAVLTVRYHVSNYYSAGYGLNVRVCLTVLVRGAQSEAILSNYSRRQKSKTMFMNILRTIRTDPPYRKYNLEIQRVNTRK